MVVHYPPSGQLYVLMQLIGARIPTRGGIELQFELDVCKEKGASEEVIGVVLCYCNYVQFITATIIQLIEIF